MRFPGRIRKDGKFWLVEIPAFDAFTQGRTKREALAMAEDLVETMAGVSGFRAAAYPSGELERLTIIMLGELAAAGKAAVAGGGYRSTSDVIREALHGEVTG